MNRRSFGKTTGGMLLALVTGGSLALEGCYVFADIVSWTNIAGIAKASGLESVRTLRDKSLLRSEIDAFLASDGPSMLVAKIQALGRGAGPRMDGQENKYKFVRHVERIAQIEILGVPKP